jgi:xylan 1,4-beta-xylosidase
VRPQGYPPTAHLGRETFLAPVQWDDAGWPHVGQHGRLSVVMESPSLAQVSWEPQRERDDFDGPQLGVAWNFLGTPATNVWSLTDRSGALRLLGNEARLDDGPPVAFVGRRQEHFACEVATRIDFEPAADGEEAGLTVWTNPSHHYDLFVTHQEGQRRVIVRRRIGSIVADMAWVSIEPGPVTLMVQAEPGHYTLGVSGKSGDQQILATGETRYLAPEVAGPFTGVFFALYTTGNGAAASAYAYFEWFDYRVAAQDSRGGH